MKTAISIDDALLEEADKTAHRIGVSRSRLFSMAVGEFLRKQKQEQMLQKLNELYAGGINPAEKQLLKGMKSKFSKTLRDRW